MAFKYCSIDPHKASVEELKAEIARMEKEMWDNYNLQYALKILLNSSYGVIGNQFFICYDRDVAEAITLQGQNIILFSAKAVNRYFQKYWMADTELHEALGVTPTAPIEKDLVVAGDTDSIFLGMQEIIENTKGIDDPLIFLLDLYEMRLKGYFQEILQIYAKKWNSTNLQEFEMEAITEKGFWLAKKKYVLQIRWKEGGSDTYKGETYPGQFFASGKKRKYTGIEIKKKSTPLFARKVLDKVIDHLFEYGQGLEMNRFTKMLKDFKDDFKLQEINDISLLSSVNNYSKYVLEDRSSLRLMKGCPVHVRAAGTYNFMINNDKKFKKKYELFKTGQKIKYYYVKADSDHRANEVFGFPVGIYPQEIAPPIDHDIMFAKVIIDPVNRFIKAMGKPKIPPTLLTTKKMF